MRANICLPETKLLAASIFLFFLFFIQQACTKIDAGGERMPSQDLMAKFFQLPANADPLLRRVADKFRQWDKVNGFVRAFAANEGMPQWNYATFHRSPAAPASFSSSVIAGGDTLIFIPLALSQTQAINGFIECSVSDTAIHAVLYRKDDYRLFGYSNSADSPSARSVALKMMYMEKAMFGHDRFNILDTNLLRIDGHPAGFCKLGNSTEPASTGWVGQTMVCYNIMVPANHGQVAGCAPGDPCVQYVPANVCETFTIWGTDIPGQSGGVYGGGPGPGVGMPSGSTGSPAGGGNGTSTPGNTTGSHPGWVVAEPRENNNPCDTLNKYAQGNDFQGLFQLLSTKVSGNQEYLFTFHNLLNPSGPTNTIDQTTGFPGKFEVYPQNESIFKQVRGWFHNHFANRDSAGLIFSAGDVNIFADQVVRDSAFFDVNYKNFMVGIVSDSGAQYILMVDDYPKFKEWANLFRTENIIEAAFNGAMLNQKFLPLSKIETEKLFLTVIQNAGLKLFRGNNDFTNWIPLGLNGNGNVINKPCN